MYYTLACIYSASVSHEWFLWHPLCIFSRAAYHPRCTQYVENTIHEINEHVCSAMPVVDPYFRLITAHERHFGMQSMHSKSMGSFEQGCSIIESKQHMKQLAFAVIKHPRIQGAWQA
jgi:hypothetical protein